MSRVGPPRVDGLPCLLVGLDLNLSLALLLHQVVPQHLRHLSFVERPVQRTVPVHLFQLLESLLLLLYSILLAHHPVVPLYLLLILFELLYQVGCDDVRACHLLITGYLGLTIDSYLSDVLSAYVDLTQQLSLLALIRHHSGLQTLRRVHARVDLRHLLPPHHLLKRYLHVRARHLSQALF